MSGVRIDVCIDTLNRSFCRSSIALDHCQCAICYFVSFIALTYVRMYYKRRNKPPSGFYLFQIQLQSSRYKLHTKLANKQWHKVHNNRMNLAIGISLQTKWIFICRLWRFFTFHLSILINFAFIIRKQTESEWAKSEKRKDYWGQEWIFLHFNFFGVLKFALYILYKKMLWTGNFGFINANLFWLELIPRQRGLISTNVLKITTVSTVEAPIVDQITSETFKSKQIPYLHRGTMEFFKNLYCFGINCLKRKMVKLVQRQQIHLWKQSPTKMPT